MSEAKWYILHTYSGYENKVANNIMKIVDNNNLHHLIEEVMVPTETVVEEHDGKTKTYESKLFPSYVYVKMVLTDESWYICRNTRGCTGCVGPGSKPIPLTDEEVKKLGVTTKVADSIDEENGTASVTVSMFGRPTPATVEISAVQKVEY